MIIIDGSDGGGQMLRTALSMSTVTLKPFTMVNIRKKRPNAGLKKQHISCIKAYEKLFDCKVIGNYIGNDKIEFYPGNLKSKKIDIDIETAGSITLFLQSLILPCFLNGNNISIKVKGGTDVKWSMSFDYFSEVIMPYYNRFAEYKLFIFKRGFYPKGKGEIELKIIKHNLTNIRKFDLTKNFKLECIKGISFASLDLEKKKVAERQSYSALNFLFNIKTAKKIELRYFDTNSIGSGITLWCIYSYNDEVNLFSPIRIGSDVLGEKNKSSEDVGVEAAKKIDSIIKNGFSCDEHLSDNLIPILGLIGGKIKINRITEHILCNIKVCEKFINKKFKIEGNIISV
jgi:RNA 3'-terminal phosphate cyclase (ATP)